MLWSLSLSSVIVGLQILMRGYPDVALSGHNYLVANNGSVFPVDGTSASAPLFASLVSILNDHRISAGMSPMGFILPFLCTHARTCVMCVLDCPAADDVATTNPDAFNDIVVGDNSVGTSIGLDAFCYFVSPLQHKSCIF